MMNVNDIQGFHIELTNMCTLKCPGCARTKFINQWPQHWYNHNLEIKQLFDFIDIDLTGKKIKLCGNYGDPIYHPQFIEFVKEFKKRNAILSIDTNGSYKSVEWWNQLSQCLDSKDEIVFSVDGVPENFTEYRINADWESISLGMSVIAKSQCNSVWKYLVFRYNENDIDTAQQLCEQIGIKSFYVEYSDRFDNDTEEFKPINTELLGIRYEKQTQFKNNQTPSVNPACKDRSQHFITADGFYSSCCFVSDHRFYYKTEFGKNKKQYSIMENTISELLKKPAVVDFYNNLQNIPACQFNCPTL